MLVFAQTVTYVIVLHCVVICCYYIDVLLLQYGWTALHRACINGHLEVVKHLLNNNADISATDDVSDYAVVYCIA